MTWLGDFHFLRPLWLLALPLVLIVLHKQRHRLAAQSAWSKVIAPELLPHVLQQGQAGASRQWLYPLAVLAALLLVLALAGPSWRQLPQPVYDSPAHRVLVVDLSSAMNAQDLKPSRLLRSQLLAQQLLEQQEEGDTALVAFAADAFAVVPLTSDRSTVSHLLHSLSPDIMPADGSNLGAGIRQASELLQQAGASQGDIVLLTGSHVDTSAKQAAKAAREAGFRLHVLAAGTPQGAPVPAAGGWQKDAQGAIRLARLDESGLRTLAAQHGGQYRRVDQLGANYALELQANLQASTASETARDLRADQWQDEGPWLLLPLLLIAALGFRRGWLVLWLISLPMVAPTPAQAGWWKNQDQSAYQQFRAEAFEQAAEQFKDPHWKASALHRAGRHAEAAALWAQQDSAQAAYNQGNALARAGELDAAIEAYDTALQRDPEFHDARANKTLLEKLKQQQEEQEQQSEQGDSSQDQPQDPSEQNQSSESESQSSDDQSTRNESSSEDGESSPETSEQDEPSQNPSSSEQDPPDTEAQDSEQAAQPGEQQDSPDQQAQAQAAEQQLDEQAQAVQQWLKRIPDDPGGLLRRKFERMQERRRESQR